VGKVLWHSLTESGEVEVVKIKFGNKVYENVSVKHLNPTDLQEHSHNTRQDDDDEMKVGKKKKVKEVVINGKRYRSI
tara:strand:- start:351 stop:581 length:231 start_codon:yes stop_codon:yes gene_type:complete